MSWVPRIGEEFAGYRLESLLGHGGMSIVYRAEHLALGRTVALKLLAPQLTEDEGFRERFTRESRLAASLDHPNIIPIYEAGERDETFFIAMRFVNGSDLKTRLHRDGPMDLAHTAGIISPVASALHAAHSKGLIHRDVKPANILVAPEEGSDGEDYVYLSDFGIAKQTDSRALTKTGVFVGTAEYAAPEQIEGKQLDGRADVYSLGCVLYECLTGARAYERDSEVALMYAHLLEPPPSVTEKRPDLPPEIDEIMQKAMAKSRDSRYESPRALAAALRALASDTARRDETMLSPAARPPAGETVLSGNRGGDGASAVAATGAGAAQTAASQPSTVTQPPAMVPPTGPLTPPGGIDQLPPGAGGPGGRRPGALVTTVLVALAAAALAGLVVFFLTRNDDNGTAGGTTAATTAPTQTATTTALGDHPLELIVPKPLWIGCSEEAPPAGADQAAACLPPTGSTVFSPDRWEIFTYPSSSSLTKAYDAMLARDRPGKPKDVGRCDGSTWGGEGTWAHGPGKPGGHRFCFFDGQDAVIVWTHEKLGQETHTDMLAVAREGGSDHTGLFNWWRFWHHRIGKVGE